MAMPIPSPPVDKRSYDDVVSTTTALVKAYTGEYSPALGGASADMGSALIHIFSRMAKHVIDRLNRVPDRSFLAFLNLIGVSPSTARSARVPLTFELAKGSQTEAFVPAGTRVADSATGKVVFETMNDLTVSAAKLSSIMVHEPDEDRFSDKLDAATGAIREPFYIFHGEQAIEHSLYIAAETILGIGAGTSVTVAMTFGSSTDAATWQALHEGLITYIAWSYWNGTEWVDIYSPTRSTSGAVWSLKFTVPANMAPLTLNGTTARFLRAKLSPYPGTTIPTVASVTVTAQIAVTDLVPDAAFSNGAPIDLSMDFYPLGEQPKLNSNIYLASAEALSKPGAKLAIEVTLSEANVTPASTKDPNIIWEVWTGSAWTQLGRSTRLLSLSGTSSYAFSDGTNAFTKGVGNATAAAPNVGKVTFTLPTELAALKLNGTESYWIRARLIKGDYGKGTQLSAASGTTTITEDTYTPPILESVALSYTYAPSATAVCLAYNNSGFTEISSGSSFVPFSRWTEDSPALYLGFDQAFSARVVQIYFQVSTLPSAVALTGPVAKPGTLKPHVTWEYSTGSGWTTLDGDDSTRSFVQSGLLRFFGPSDLAARTVFGKSLFWLRARFTSGSYASAPQLGRVLPNTVIATNTTTIRDENLGSSNGGAGQTFTLSQAPVLDGEQIEVMELEAPSETDLAMLETLTEEGFVTRGLDPSKSTEQVWVRWLAVPDFNSSSPKDRHYVISRSSGEIRFGDGIHGMSPPRGRRNVRAKIYQTGGTAAGNIAAGGVSKLLTTVPYVDSVTNYEPGTGGADEGSLTALKERGTHVLRHRHRAVTFEDFEDLAYEASSSVARAKAIPPVFDPIALVDDPVALTEAGQVLLILVANSTDKPPMPSLGLIQEVETYVKARCAPAVSLQISTPIWVEVSVSSMEIVPTSYDAVETLRGTVLAALDRFLDPLTGGSRGAGWSFGQVPHKSDLYRLLSSIPGIRLIRNVTIAMIYAGSVPVVPFEEDKAGDKLSNVLIFSGTHSVSIVSPDEDV
jgi:predicted phage baseplate assembly protein